MMWATPMGRLQDSRQWRILAADDVGHSYGAPTRRLLSRFSRRWRFEYLEI
jgi:hypothetical protein